MNPLASLLAKSKAKDPFWEYLEKLKRMNQMGLTSNKIWAFLEERLGVRGKEKKFKRVGLPLWMAKALKEEAKKERLSEAELMRRALTIYLELKPEEREELVQSLRGRWWNIDYLQEHLEEVEEAYKRELLREKQKRTSSATS
jgi:hypothetical protein